MVHTRTPSKTKEKGKKKRKKGKKQEYCIHVLYFVRANDKTACQNQYFKNDTDLVFLLHAKSFPVSMEGWSLL